MGLAMTADANGNQKQVYAELQEAASNPNLRPRELFVKFRTLVHELMRLYLSQHRPLLSYLYNASRDATALYQEAKARYRPMDESARANLTLATFLGWLQKDGIGILNYWPFALLQQSSANVYAAILLFECDKLIREQKRFLEISGELETGPQFAGHHFSRIIRAAGNQYRHGATWPEDATLGQEDAQVLRDIGVTNLRAPTAQAETLALIGGSTYFDFEERFIKSVVEIGESLT